MLTPTSRHRGVSVAPQLADSADDRRTSDTGMLAPQGRHAVATEPVPEEAQAGVGRPRRLPISGRPSPWRVALGSTRPRRRRGRSARGCPALRWPWSTASRASIATSSGGAVADLRPFRPHTSSPTAARWCRTRARRPRRRIPGRDQRCAVNPARSAYSGQNNSSAVIPHACARSRPARIAGVRMRGALEHETIDADGFRAPDRLHPLTSVCWVRVLAGGDHETRVRSPRWLASPSSRCRTCPRTPWIPHDVRTVATTAPPPDPGAVHRTRTVSWACLGLGTLVTGAAAGQAQDGASRSTRSWLRLARRRRGHVDDAEVVVGVVVGVEEAAVVVSLAACRGATLGCGADLGG